MQDSLNDATLSDGNERPPWGSTRAEWQNISAAQYIHILNRATLDLPVRVAATCVFDGFALSPLKEQMYNAARLYMVKCRSQEGVQAIYHSLFQIKIKGFNKSAMRNT